jgi:hypothetical protein
MQLGRLKTMSREACSPVNRLCRVGTDVVCSNFLNAGSIPTQQSPIDSLSS